jgi:hypothetical protein
MMPKVQNKFLNQGLEASQSGRREVLYKTQIRIRNRKCCGGAVNI